MSDNCGEIGYHHNDNALSLLLCERLRTIMKTIRYSQFKQYLYSLCLILLVGLSSFSAQSVFAKEYTFSWAQNPPPITGYRLYYKKEGIAGPPFYGIDAAEGSSPIDIGNQTSFTVSGLEEDTVYHFALTAYHGDGESDFSSVVTVGDGDTPPHLPALILNTINLLLLDDETKE